MYAQVESFANQGQGVGLYPETCSPALEENTLYDITLTVTDAQYIQYDIRNPYTMQIIYSSPAVYDPSFIDGSITGWWIGNVSYLQRDWSLHFMNITTGWN